MAVRFLVVDRAIADYLFNHVAFRVSDLSVSFECPGFLRPSPPMPGQVLKVSIVQTILRLGLSNPADRGSVLEFRIPKHCVSATSVAFLATPCPNATTGRRLTACLFGVIANAFRIEGCSNIDLYAL